MTVLTKNKNYHDANLVATSGMGGHYDNPIATNDN